MTLVTGTSAAIAALAAAGSAAATVTVPVDVGRIAWNARMPADIERLGRSSGVEDVVVTVGASSLLTTRMTIAAAGAADRLLAFLRKISVHYGL